MRKYGKRRESRRVGEKKKKYDTSVGLHDHLRDHMLSEHIHLLNKIVCRKISCISLLNHHCEFPGRVWAYCQSGGTFLECIPQYGISSWEIAPPGVLTITAKWLITNSEPSRDPSSFGASFPSTHWLSHSCDPSVCWCLDRKPRTLCFKNWIRHITSRRSYAADWVWWFILQSQFVDEANIEHLQRHLLDRVIHVSHSYVSSAYTDRHFDTLSKCSSSKEAQ